MIGDNGSSDGSQAIATSLGARVVNAAVRGYGSALLEGITSARGRFIIMGDADDSYDFAHLNEFVAALRTGADLVMGNRFRGGIRPHAMPWLNRYLGNPVLSGLGRLFFRVPVGDFHCGLRGFSRAAFDRMDLRTTGMEFASEMVVKAGLLKMKIVEVPTTLSPDGRSGPPHLRRWRDGWRHLRFLLIYSPQWLFFYPGACLMAVGALTGAWLLSGPRTVAGTTYDVHTLIYAAMAVLVGFQGISFSAFCNLFALSEGLLPEDPRLDRLARSVTLETGLIVGSIFLLLGLGVSFVALGRWSNQNFGPLDPAKTLRLVIPAATSVVMGCQIILSSFFLSILWVRRRRPHLNRYELD
mgnify:CR=1 FL=1